jgi:two-component sensor histidine kinase
MQDSNNPNTSGEPNGRERIRHLFGADLEAVGVDCFSVYVQDLWNDGPDISMPQEIDERLWYREPMRATTPPDYLKRLRRILTTERSDADTEMATYKGTASTFKIPMHAWFASDALRVPGNQTDYAAEFYSPCERLFQSFVRREMVASVAVFMTDSSITHRFFANRLGERDNAREWLSHTLIKPDRPEFLFLNFRTENSFGATVRAELGRLASSIFGFLPWMILERSKSWPPMMIRAIRTQSTIAEFASGSMRRPSLSSDTEVVPQQQEDTVDPTTPAARATGESSPLPRTHDLNALRNKLDELIQPVLDQIANTRGQGPTSGEADHPSPPREMVISVYLLDPCGEGEAPLHGGTDGLPGLYLSNVAQLSTWDGMDLSRPTLPAGAELRTQRCFYGKPSITVCTVLTGRSYYLEVVDDEGACSFDFTLDHGPARRQETNRAMYEFASAVKSAGFPTQGPNNLPCFELRVTRRAKGSGPKKHNGTTAVEEGLITAAFDPQHPPQDRIDPRHWATLQDIASKFNATWVVVKLRRLVECDYSQIYRKVTNPPAEGQGQRRTMPAGRAMAELCVPILVDRQAIGCVNLEYFGLKLPDYTATNMLFNLATTIGSVVVDTQTKTMLASIEHAVNRILTEQIKKPSDYGIDHLTKTAQRSLRVQDVTILARDPFRPDEPFTELGGSWGSATESRGTLTPRECGWTRFISEQQSDNFCGVILQTDGVSTDVRDAFKILISHKSKTPSPQVRRLHHYATPTSSDKGDDRHTVNPPESERWMRQCRFFMGLALRDPNPRGGGSSPIVGVMWCVAEHPPTELPPRRDSGESVHRDVPFALRKYVHHAVELAKRCSLVPTIYRSNLFSPARFMKLSTHGDIPTITTHLKEDLLTVSRFLKSAELVLRERSDYEHRWAMRMACVQSMVNSAKLRASYLTDWLSCVGRLCSARPQEELRDHIEALANHRDISLHEIIQEAKEIASGYPSNRNAEFTDEYEPTIRVRTCPSVLREILVQVLSNALKHGKSPDGVGRIVIRASTDGTRLKIAIRDHGPGNRESRAVVSAPDAPHRNGVRIIESLAAALCGAGRYHQKSYDPPTSGVEWTFDLLPIKEQ